MQEYHLGIRKDATDNKISQFESAYAAQVACHNGVSITAANLEAAQTKYRELQSRNYKTATV